MEWEKPESIEISLACEISSYANAELSCRPRCSRQRLCPRPSDKRAPCSMRRKYQRNRTCPNSCLSPQSPGLETYRAGEAVIAHNREDRSMIV